MLNNLAFAAIFVIVVWVIILGIFIIVSRNQPNVADRIMEIEDQINQMDPAENEQ